MVALVWGEALIFPSPPEASLAALAPDLRWLIATVRQVLAGATGARDVDLFAVCELLALDRHTAAKTYATALALGLGQALGRPFCAGHPGMQALSFDEIWLLRLVERCHAHDAESVAFLISSRIGPPCRSAIAFLVAGLAHRIAQDPPSRARCRGA